jgi:hypothetical protein
VSITELLVDRRVTPSPGPRHALQNLPPSLGCTTVVFKLMSDGSGERNGPAGHSSIRNFALPVQASGGHSLELSCSREATDGATLGASPAPQNVLPSLLAITTVLKWLKPGQPSQVGSSAGANQRFEGGRWVGLGLRCPKIRYGSTIFWLYGQIR